MAYCKNCGEEYQEVQKVCLKCGVFIDPVKKTITKDKHNDVGMQLLTTLLIIFFYPFGIPFMWITGTFTKKTRWIITLAFLIAIVLGIGSLILWTSSPGYIH